MAKLGYEVEGRLKGVYSLFVEVDEIKRLLNPENQYLLDQVGQVSVPDYESKITLDDIDILMSLDNRVVITLETPRIDLPLQDLPGRLNLVLVVPCPQFFDLSITDQIKFVNESRLVFMIPKESMVVTSPDEFDGDEEVDIL